MDDEFFQIASNARKKKKGVRTVSLSDPHPTLSCQFVPGAQLGWVKTRRGRKRGEGGTTTVGTTWREKPPPAYSIYLHSLLYILLLAVNSTDLHKETTRDAHVNSSVILLARGESREKKWPRTFRFPFLEREKERGEFSRKLSLNERGRRREARRKLVCRVVRGQRGECARHAGYAKLERSCVGRGRRVGGWGPKTDRIHDERQFRFCPSASFATEI